ncbi:F0F1 ATP synthase subunit gamma [Mangrovitalea sediminis]|uniref:F0F1 ATP synthase subunit gamma n=1 Tax=Mangrovitalea sediminis TaxID=1982043 RepID=UPI000BE5C7E3|nr:F0F1 ATP synthase subunit gamma [Mangrovitalea sediminis]
MAALEELRHSIETVTDLQTVVRTMKSLALASIHQYEQAMASLTDYTRTVEMGLYVVLRDMAPRGRLPRPPAHAPRAVAIIFGSDRGLCGRFNEDIAHYAVERLNGLHIRHEDRLLLSVGTRVDGHLADRHHATQESFTVPSSIMAIGDTVRQLVQRVDHYQRLQGNTQVLLFYNRNLPNRRGREPHMLRLLPIDLERLHARVPERWPGRSLPTYTEARPALLAALTRQLIFSSLFRACTESLSSEHSSRLAAMQVAEKNIDEHLTELGTRFSQERQEMITEELLDLMGGFEALTGNQAPG